MNFEGDDDDIAEVSRPELETAYEEINQLKTELDTVYQDLDHVFNDNDNLRNYIDQLKVDYKNLKQELEDKKQSLEPLEQVLYAVRNIQDMYVLSRNEWLIDALFSYVTPIKESLNKVPFNYIKFKEWLKRYEDKIPELNQNNKESKYTIVQRKLFKM